jgi:hypothetical protein
MMPAMAFATKVVDENVIMAPIIRPTKVRIRFLSSTVIGRVKMINNIPVTKITTKIICCIIFSLENNFLFRNRKSNNRTSESVTISEMILGMNCSISTFALPVDNFHF